MLNDYINLLKNIKFDIIKFKGKGTEKMWTTKEIFDSFNISLDSDISNSPQTTATILIMQKSNKLIKVFEDCLEKIRKDHNLITDYYNNVQKHDSFRENRHDQSFLSLAFKINGCITLKERDYTWISKSYGQLTRWTTEEALKIPFLAARLRNGDI